MDWFLRMVNGSIDEEVEDYFERWWDEDSDVEWIMTWPKQ